MWRGLLPRLVSAKKAPSAESSGKANKPALGNPLRAPWLSRRVASNLNLKRRGAPGSGLPGLYVRFGNLCMTDPQAMSAFAKSGNTAEAKLGLISPGFLAFSSHEHDS
jgi:hypothetical protein